MGNDMFANKKLWEIPLYTAADVSRFVRVPDSTIRAWAFGQKYEIDGRIQRFKPVLEVPDKSLKLLSFTNLVETHVLSILRRKRNIALPKLRIAIEYMRKYLNHPHPLAVSEFRTGGKDVFIEKAGLYISTTTGGQAGLPIIIDKILDRIEYDKNEIASKLYLFTRPDILSSQRIQPKSIVVDPSICFGRPVIDKTRIRTEIIADRFRAGEDPDYLARDYDCDVHLINEAIRFEHLHSHTMAA